VCGCFRETEEDGGDGQTLLSIALLTCTFVQSTPVLVVCPSEFRWVAISHKVEPLALIETINGVMLA
jgi:hypothetical protein